MRLLRWVLWKRRIVFTRGFHNARWFIRLSKEPDVWYFAIGYWEGSGQTFPKPLGLLLRLCSTVRVLVLEVLHLGQAFLRGLFG